MPGRGYGGVYEIVVLETFWPSTLIVAIRGVGFPSIIAIILSLALEIFRFSGANTVDVIIVGDGGRGSQAKGIDCCSVD